MWFRKQGFHGNVIKRHIWSHIIIMVNMVYFMIEMTDFTSNRRRQRPIRMHLEKHFNEECAKSDLQTAWKINLLHSWPKFRLIIALCACFWPFFIDIPLYFSSIDLIRNYNLIATILTHKYVNKTIYLRQCTSICVNYTKEWWW